MNWEPHAQRLADSVADRRSRWHQPLRETPRHLFAPHWWERTPSGWTRHSGPADSDKWLTAAYNDTSLVTRVGPHHADRAKPDDHPTGRPTSSATLPSLTVRMLRHARIADDDELLEIGTGSGYGTALAADRLDSQQVTSIDNDPYLIEAALERTARLGRTPTFEVADATAQLPFSSGQFDRVVSTVALRPIPAGILDVLCVGGRLVTTLAGTTLILTATKVEDGSASGHVEWDRAGFMPTRRGPDYPPGASDLLDTAREQTSEHTTTGPYPVVDVANAWDLQSMLDLTAPGIEHLYTETDDGVRTALMAHTDGSWARATAHGTEPATVDQGGPRRLWDLLDDLRTHWLTEGELPVRGARAFIRPDGTTILARGQWHTTIEPPTEATHP